MQRRVMTMEETMIMEVSMEEMISVEMISVVETFKIFPIPNCPAMFFFLFFSAGKEIDYSIF